MTEFWEEAFKVGELAAEKTAPNRGFAKVGLLY